LTPSIRDAYLNRLDQNKYSEQELLDYYNEFNECQEGPDLGKAMRDGIAALQLALSQLNDSSIILFIIG
jgi:hypothetical protein